MSIQHEVRTVAARSDCPTRFGLLHTVTAMESRDMMLCAEVIGRTLADRQGTGGHGSRQGHSLPDSCYVKPYRHQSPTLWKSIAQQSLVAAFDGRGLEGICPSFVSVLAGVRDRILAPHQPLKVQDPDHVLGNPDDQCRSCYRKEVVSGYGMSVDGGLSQDDGNRVSCHETRSLDPSASPALAFPYLLERKPRPSVLVTRVD